jgi:hypothetical protein
MFITTITIDDDGDDYVYFDDRDDHDDHDDHDYHDDDAFLADTMKMMMMMTRYNDDDEGFLSLLKM